MSRCCRRHRATGAGPRATTAASCRCDRLRYLCRWVCAAVSLVALLVLWTDGHIVSRILFPHWYAQADDPLLRPPVMSSSLCSYGANATELLLASGVIPPAWITPRFLRLEELSFLSGSCVPRLPLVLEAALGSNVNSSAATLAQWLAPSSTAAALKQLVRDQGAVVLRGFSLDGQQFERLLAREMRMPPAPYTGSIGRREKPVQKDNRTFVTRYPPYMVLMPHIEFGNMVRRPEFVSFFCATPAEQYGETPFVDFAHVWARLSPALQHKFASGVRFTTRMYPTFPYKYLWGDLASSWQDSLATDADTALERCRLLTGVHECRWAWDGALEFVTEFPGVHQDITGTPPVLSTTFGFWNSELPLLALLRVSIRLSLWQRLWGYGLLRCNFWGTHCVPTPTRATLLDGSSLNVAESRELSALIWSSSVIFPPEQGDIALLNNRRIGHGRLNVGGSPQVRKLESYISGSFNVGDEEGRYDESAHVSIFDASASCLHQSCSPQPESMGHAAVGIDNMRLDPLTK